MNSKLKRKNKTPFFKTKYFNTNNIRNNLSNDYKTGVHHGQG